MPLESTFKTNDFTVMEYHNMDLIICVEYENENDPNNKFLKIVINREYDTEMINIFDLDDLPKVVQEIYDYSRTVSKIGKEDDTYVIYGQRIHKNNNNYQKIMFHNTNPVGKTNVEISSEILNVADIDYINNEVSEYYQRVLNTIRSRGNT